MDKSNAKPTDAWQVRVRSVTYLGEDVNAYEVVPLEMAELPAFTAGSHIDLYFRDGRVRQYSLCGDPADNWHYVFAVQREEHGRGGSKTIHEIVQAGRILAISAPRNNFRLREEAIHHVLIGGGIGVTPIVSMIRRLLATGASFEVHYGARTPGKLAFHEELKALGLGERLHIYIDGGNPEKGMRSQTIVSQAPTNSHFYCCGPAGLMSGLKAATEHLPSERIHFEHFVAVGPTTPVPTQLMSGERDTIGVSFKVRLAKLGKIFDVPDDKSIVEVLRENGVEVSTSCESGLCGTCRTRYLEGEPEHNDYVLDAQERRHEVLICCARSKTQTLVLDL
jgi:vanillate O-demethylase ferredoxin subunit